jgi:hypothetical protein
MIRIHHSSLFCFPPPFFPHLIFLRILLLSLCVCTHISFLPRKAFILGGGGVQGVYLLFSLALSLSLSLYAEGSSLNTSLRYQESPFSALYFYLSKFKID